jgi:hypothetical protein
VIIKDINNENVEQLPDDDDAAGDSSFKTKSKRKSKSKSRPTRSLRGSLMPAVKSERDPVMTKLSGEHSLLRIWILVMRNVDSNCHAAIYIATRCP